MATDTLGTLLEASSFGGVNNQDETDRIRTVPSEVVDLSEAVNVLITDQRKVAIRPGATLVKAIAGSHSGYSDGFSSLCMVGPTLCVLDPSTGNTDALLNVGTADTMRYCQGAGRVFFTNGRVVGEYHKETARLFGSTTVPFKAPLPGGSAIAHHKGRLYVAVDSVLYVSDVKPLSRYDLRHGFKQFPEQITTIASAPDGLYVGTVKGVYFATGGNPMKMPFTRVYSAQTMNIPPVVIDLADIGAEMSGVVPILFTDDGPLVCSLSGQTSLLTGNAYRPAKGSKGAAYIRHDRLGTHYITSYR